MWYISPLWKIRRNSGAVVAGGRLSAAVVSLEAGSACAEMAPDFVCF
jgi:hypothetical protein